MDQSPSRTDSSRPPADNASNPLKRHHADQDTAVKPPQKSAKAHMGAGPSTTAGTHKGVDPNGQTPAASPVDPTCASTDEFRNLRENHASRDQAPLEETTAAALQEKIFELRSVCREKDDKITAKQEEIVALQKDRSLLREKMQRLCNEMVKAIEGPCGTHPGAAGAPPARAGGFHQAQQCLRPQNRHCELNWDDGSVKAGFWSVRGAVRQFTYKHARPVLQPTQAELHNHLPNWSRALPQFLSHTFLYNHVFEAYIWRCLLDTVFQPGRGVWPAGLGAPLESVMLAASGKAVQPGVHSELHAGFHNWRAQSYSLVEQLGGEGFPHELFDSDIDRMCSTFRELCGCDESSFEAMRDDAVGIFKEGRHFRIQLQRLRGVYTVTTEKPVSGVDEPRSGMIFDDDDMEEISVWKNAADRGSPEAVDFIASPGLYKIGRNDGRDYHLHSWVVKIGVVCDANRFAPGLKPPSRVEKQE